MSDSNETLPMGWQIASLDDVAEIIRGLTFPSSEKRTEPTDGCVICLRTTNVQDQVEWEDVLYIPRTFVKSQDRWLQPSDTLISMANSYELVGKVALAKEIPDEATFGGFIAAIRTRGIDPKYLFFLLREPETKERIRRTSSRTVNIANISMKNLGPTPLRIAPLAEQRRIVAKIEALQERSRKAREALAEVGPLLEQFRQSLLAAAFRGDLTADWRAAHPHVEPATELLTRIRTERRQKWEQTELAKYEAKGKQPPKDWMSKYVEPIGFCENDAFELPQVWHWSDLEFVMDDQRPYCYGVVQPGDDTPSGVCLIRAGDLEGGSIRERELRRIPEDVHNAYPRSKVEGGEILVTVVGANIGVSALVPFSCRGFNVARALAKVPVADFDTQFVRLWLTDSYAFSWMKMQAREVARPTLNLEQLKRLPIPIPPIEEQKEIVRRVEKLLENADRTACEVTTSESDLVQLDQSILAKAFRGELEPQDPNDEPALVLLERIRQQWESPAAKIGKAKGRRRSHGKDAES